MSPQWLPQNLQKRLLLYVLQQLSLFSEIDLPNLEQVSLNNIHLKNISIDPEKVGNLIPGCNLRYGQVGNFELNGGVMGGVNVEASDLDIVVAFKFSDSLDQDISKSVQFLLAQSTQDLANTIILGQSDILKESLKESEELEQQDNSPGSSSPKTSKPSALSGVMNRAVDLALLRLQVRIKNINIKLLSELADLVIKIDEAYLNTVNGTRSVKFNGIKVVSLSPDVNPGDFDKPGETQDTANETTNDSNEDGNSGADCSSEEEEDEDDVEEDDTFDQSLMDSMVFTHEEASSIYMSATSLAFKKENTLPKPTLEQKDRPDSVIIHILELNFEFEGLSQISNIFLSVSRLTIACSPLVPVAFHIVTSITRGLKLKIYHKKKQSSKKQLANSKFPQYQYENDDIDEPDDDDDDDEEGTSQDSKQLFNRLHIAETLISVTSAITLEGQFASPKNNLFLKLLNCNVKQKHDKLVYGGIETFSIIQTKEGVESTVLTFNDTEEESAKADVRFELFSKISSDYKINEFTLLLSKSVQMNLNSYSMQNMMELSTNIQTLIQGVKNMLANLETYNSLDGVLIEKDKLDTHIIFQSSHMTIDIDFNDLEKIQIQVLPISMNLLADELKCQKILIDSVLQDKDISTEHRIASISNIFLSTKSRDFKTYINHSNLFSRGVNVSCSNNISISRINIEVPFKVLKRLIKLAGKLSSEMQEVLPRYSLADIGGGMSSTISVYNTTKKLKKRVNILPTNSMHVADFNLSIEEINFSALLVSKSFGDIIGKVSDTNIFKMNGDTNLVTKFLKLSRVHETATEKFIYYYDEKSHVDKDRDPVVIGQIKSRGPIEVKFQKLVIEGYVSWQKLFEKDIEEIEEKLDHPNKANYKVEDLNNATPVSNEKKFDLRIQFKDTLLGITPLQIQCKGFLNINQMTLDFIITPDQLYLKTTIRDLTILLIDDIGELKPTNHQKFKLLHMTPLTYFLNRGYLNVGNINNLHIGVTYNFDEIKLINRNKSKNLYNKLSLLDVKINLDEINIETCGDSFYTLVQMINDLKVPLVLQDKEKFKISLNDEVDLMKEIEKLQFQQPVSATTPEPLIPIDNDFEIVDEYYGEDGAMLNQSIEHSLTDQIKNLKVDENYFNKKTNINDIKITPVSINVNLGKFNLYMYDGYDWKQTRKMIKGAVKRVEEESLEEPETSVKDPEEDEDDEDLEVIQETLFQSIHVSLPKGIDPSILTQNINKQVNENESEDDLNSVNYKDLKLRRSSKYKILIELKSIDVNLIIHTLRDPLKDPDTGETFEKLNEIELVVDYLTIYDNLVNSTWNKYLSYMSSLGEKEIGQNMLKIQITTIRNPVDLNFNETEMKVSILPIRLFIDQDTNEFLIRFFKFTDHRFQIPKLEEDIYLKKFEILKNLKVKIDYKPKKISLIGLKNGELNELLNLININGLVVSFNQIKLYGIKGIDKLFIKMFQSWLPNIQKTQLINIFNGIELFKPFINIGESFKNLVTFPINDYNDLTYKKLNKNGKEFLKTTGYELLKLGYKLTNGTQSLLEQGEEMLGGTGSKSRKSVKNKPKSNQNKLEGYVDSISDEEESLLENSMRLNKSHYETDQTNIYQNSRQKYSDVDEINDRYGKSEEYEDEDELIEDHKAISLYSNQPQNFKQGMILSYKSINKNYKLTKNEFLQLIEKLNESSNYEESMKVLLQKSPLLVLRPMIGTTEIISKTLMGLSNEINKTELRENQDKYK